MISIPYTYIAFSLCLLVGFFKIGDLDDEIGWALGLGAGVLALVLNHFFIGGYLGLLVHAIIAFVLLTIYKIIRGLPETKKQSDDENVEH